MEEGRKVIDLRPGGATPRRRRPQSLVRKRDLSDDDAADEDFTVSKRRR